MACRLLLDHRPPERSEGPREPVSEAHRHISLHAERAVENVNGTCDNQ